MIETPWWLSLLLGRKVSPTESRYEALVSALSQGDQPMDAVARKMLANPEIRQDWNMALQNGGSATSNAPGEIKRLFAELANDPPWLDRALLKEGVLATHRGGTALPLVLRNYALMGGYLLTGFNRTLIMTGELTKGVLPRMIRTSRWWLDCTALGGLQPFATGFKSTLQVRLVHSMVRLQLEQNPEWDHLRWGTPINQADLLATYLAFAVVPLIGMRALGVPVSPSESRAIMHLWKYIGWLIGVDEKWLVDSELAAAELLLQTFATQSPPDWTSEALGSALARAPLELELPWRHEKPLTHFLLRHWLYHMHLSTNRWFLSSRQMKELGLSARVVPWFPALSFAPRFAWQAGCRLTKAGRMNLARQGRVAQLRLMGISEKLEPDAKPHQPMKAETSIVAEST